MSSFARLCLVLFCSLTVLSGCGDSSKSNKDSAYPKQGADKGDFKVAMVPAVDRDDQNAEDFIKETGTVKGIAEAMNETLNLPRNVKVEFSSTDEGPAYTSADHTIVFGYPFVDYIAGVFAQAYPDASQKELLQKTDNVVGFILMHEMGHALVDLYDLPITGREEDSVDNLATVITVGALPNGDQIAFDFADFFSQIQNDPSKLSEVDFWDEHSLDVQRANQTVCLIYGSDPGKYSDLAEFIPEERRELCPDEWQQQDDSWSKLLDPHTKP